MSRNDAIKALKDIRGRSNSYMLAHDMYEGTREEVFASANVRRLLKETGVTFRLDVARIPVDAVLNRLELANVSTEAEGDNPIADIWEHNELDLEINEFHRWALVYGEAYGFVWPEDEVAEIELATPLTTTIIYDERKPRVKAYAAQAWETSEDTLRITLWYPNEIRHYESVKGKRPRDVQEPDDLVPYVPEDASDSTEENPYGEIPFFHFRTQRPHGRPEHKGAFGPQDAINKLVTTMMSAIDFHGVRQRYALTKPGNGTDGFSPGDDDDDGYVDDDMSQLKSGPGELWILDADEVGEFQASDMSNFLDPLREFTEAAAWLTQTPQSFFKGLAGAPSGESRKAEQSGLTKKVEDRQISFGSTWKSLFSFALKVSNVNDASVVLTWHPAEVNDTKEDWETAKVKREVGLPFPQVLKEMGYDETEIADIGEPDPATPTNTEEAA